MSKDKKHIHEQQQKQNHFFHGQPAPVVSKQHDNTPAPVSEADADARPDAPIISPLAQQKTDSTVVVPVSGGKVKIIDSSLFDRAGGKKKRQLQKENAQAIEARIKEESIKAFEQQALAAKMAAEQALKALGVITQTVTAERVLAALKVIEKAITLLKNVANANVLSQTPSSKVAPKADTKTRR